MIRELMFGAAVVGGGGYYMLSSYSAAEVRTVNATPADTWRAFDAMGNYWNAMADFTAGGDSNGWGSGEAAMRPLITSVPGKEVDFRLQKNGVEAARIHVTFESLGDGKQTRMTMAVEVNPDALPEKERGRFNGIMFKQGVREMANRIIPEIESGRMLRLAETMADIRRQMMANPQYAEMQRGRDEYKKRAAQEKAAAPMLDPNAAAMNPRGADVTPDNPNPRTRY